MPVHINREYMVTCGEPFCQDFVGYEYTPVEFPRAKDMYKGWRELGWKKRGKEWFCPQHSDLPDTKEGSDAD